MKQEKEEFDGVEEAHGAVRGSKQSRGVSLEVITSGKCVEG